MCRVSLPRVLLLAAALLTGGCQSWRFEWPKYTALSPTADAETVPPALTADAWRANTRWTPRHEWGSRRDDRPDPQSLRWEFDLPTAVRGASAEDAAGGTGKTVDAGAEWNGLTTPTLDRLLITWQRESASDNDAEPEPRAVLTHLARRDDRAGWNAMILLARRDPAAAVEFASRLEELTAGGGATDAEPPVSSALRCAAAEAWCLVLAQADGDPTDALAPAGRLLERLDLPLDVRCELYRGVARRVPPAVIPGLASAFETDAAGEPSAPVEARRAAMEACLIHALWNPPSSDEADGSRWPDVLLDRLRNPALIRERDTVVRRTLAQWLIVTEHPAAAGVLADQIQSSDPQLRDEAIASLGLLGTDTARAELLRLARRSEELIRTAAVRGLARWGVTALLPLAGDESYLVRRTVAEELGRFPTVEAALVLRELAADRHPDVQGAAVRAAAAWPAALSVPLLLHGLSEGTFRTRAACLERLQVVTGRPLTFAINAPREERAAAVVALAREHQLPLGYWGEMARDDRPTAPRPADPQHTAEIQADLRRVTDGQTPTDSAEYHDALDRLRGLRPADVPLVETFILQAASPATAVLMTEVLPRLSGAYAALRELESDDVFTRRRGIQTLASLGERESLSRLVVRALADHMVREQDALVWRLALAAVERDGTDESARLAGLAAQNGFADVRLLACDFAARHRRPQDADWLLPLLSDSESSVRTAAVRAAGLCPNRLLIDGLTRPDAEPLPGLRQLLTDADPQVRLAAAVGMSRCGDSAGIDELIRLSYAPDAAVRESVVRAMGTTGQTRFVGHLVRLAWTERNEAVRRALLDGLERLTPPENRPAGLARHSGGDAKIRAWMQWWQDQSGQRSAFSGQQKDNDETPAAPWLNADR